MLSRQVKIAGQVVENRTHSFPDLDEDLGLLLAAKYGSLEWIKQYCPNGILYLGIPGPDMIERAFDEHPDMDAKTERKHGDSCATLVAKSVGVDEHPVWKRILAYALAQDLEGEAEQFDFATFIKTWHYVNRWLGNDGEAEVTRWAFTGLSAMVYGELQREAFKRSLGPETEQTQSMMAERDRVFGSPFRLSSLALLVRQYLPNESEARAWEQIIYRVQADSTRGFKAAIDELTSRAEVMTLEEGRKKIRVCIIDTGNPFVQRGYRSKEWAGRCEALIQFTPSGGFLIGQSRKSGLKMIPAAEAIRAQVYRAKVERGLWNNSDIPSPDKMRYEGRLPGSDEVFFFRAGGMIMNKSPKYPEHPALVGEGRLLTRQQVIDATIAGIRRELQNHASPSQ